MAKLLLFFGALALAQVLDNPVITAAPQSTEVGLFPGDSSNTEEPCKSFICYDYINTCAIRYGGCYPACAGNARPTYSGALCDGGRFRSSFSKPSLATPSNTCGYKCDFTTDTCGNAFGPGCYTSCVGIEPPRYTIPSCNAVATPTQTTYVTSAPAVSVVPLFVPLDALNRRQEDSTAALTITSELATTTASEISTEYTPEPISERIATVAFDLSTMGSQTTGPPAATNVEISTDTPATTSVEISTNTPPATSVEMSTSTPAATSVETSPSGSANAGVVSSSVEADTESSFPLSTSSVTGQFQTASEPVVFSSLESASSANISRSELSVPTRTGNSSSLPSITATVGLASSDVEAASARSTPALSTSSSAPGQSLNATETVLSSSLEPASSANSSETDLPVPTSTDNSPASTTSSNGVAASASSTALFSTTSAVSELKTATEAVVSSPLETASSASISESDETSSATITATAESAEAQLPSPTVTDSNGSGTSTTVVSENPVMRWSPLPVPPGGATIGANLATIRPLVYGYLPVADIMDPPQAPAPPPVITPAATTSYTPGIIASQQTWPYDGGAWS